ncbi:unnamed protein product [Peronospora effusa]|nr:unnamed protein product [Peronospora effusa]
MTTFGLDRCPQIKLTPGDRALYDCAAKKFLQGTVAERAKFNPKNIDPQQWAFVKRQKETSWVDFTVTRRMTSAPPPCF